VDLVANLCLLIMYLSNCHTSDGKPKRFWEQDMPKNHVLSALLVELP